MTANKGFYSAAPGNPTYFLPRRKQIPAGRTSFPPQMPAARFIPSVVPQATYGDQRAGHAPRTEFLLTILPGRGSW
jgi:hypothetical protein